MAFFRTVSRPSEADVLHWTVRDRTVALCGAGNQRAATRGEKWAADVCLECFKDERLSAPAERRGEGGAVNCEECHKQQASHRIARPLSYYVINLCCECYVRRGNPPSDWHPLCMRTFYESRPAIER